MSGFSSAKKFVDRLLARKIELGAIAFYQIGKTLRLKSAHQGAVRRSRDGLQ